MQSGWLYSDADEPREAIAPYTLASNVVISQDGMTLLDALFPVGSIQFFADDSFNPNGHYPGSWSKIEGVFLLASSSNHAVGTRGGDETHTLSVEELPSHSHPLDYSLSNSTEVWTAYSWHMRGTARSGIGGTTSVGGNQPHNNMPPFLTVNVWKRTS